jgi:hypothetical protein
MCACFCSCEITNKENLSEMVLLDYKSRYTPLHYQVSLGNHQMFWLTNSNHFMIEEMEGVFDHMLNITISANCGKT